MDVSTFTSHRRTLSTAAGEIACTEWGAGPAAVFVHGVFTSGALWRHVIERLSDTTRCIAVDLPGHGATPPRADQTVAAMAGMVAGLCEGLGLDRVDLVGNDTGGAIAQLVATQYPELLRSLTLTNCDTEGNFPPEGFAPIVALAARGEVAALLPPLAADPEAARTSMLAGSFEHPGKTPDDMWREYLVPIGGDIERARSFERLIGAIDPVQMKGVNDLLSGLDVPTLLVWGTGEAMIGVEWAYRLRDLIPQVREVVEVPGAKLFFPEERPEELATPLRRFWGR